MTIEAQFQERAEEGDGAFAIAWALLRLTAAVRDLGTVDAASEMGALEYVASHIGDRIDAAATQIAAAIEKKTGE